MNLENMPHEKTQKTTLCMTPLISNVHKGTSMRENIDWWLP